MEYSPFQDHETETTQDALNDNTTLVCGLNPQCFLEINYELKRIFRKKHLSIINFSIKHFNIPFNLSLTSYLQATSLNYHGICFAKFDIRAYRILKWNPYGLQTTFFQAMNKHNNWRNDNKHNSNQTCTWLNEIYSPDLVMFGDCRIWMKGYV